MQSAQKCGNCGNFIMVFWSAANYGGGHGIHDFKTLPWPLKTTRFPEHWPAEFGLLHVVGRLPIVGAAEEPGLRRCGCGVAGSHETDSNPGLAPLPGERLAWPGALAPTGRTTPSRIRRGGARRQHATACLVGLRRNSASVRAGPDNGHHGNIRPASNQRAGVRASSIPAERLPRRFPRSHAGRWHLCRRYDRSCSRLWLHVATRGQAAFADLIKNSRWTHEPCGSTSEMIRDAQPSQDVRSSIRILFAMRSAPRVLRQPQSVHDRASPHRGILPCSRPPHGIE